MIELAHYRVMMGYMPIVDDCQHDHHMLMMAIDTMTMMRVHMWLVMMSKRMVEVMLMNVRWLYLPCYYYLLLSRLMLTMMTNQQDKNYYNVG
jgi:hypothetical protein